mmetsp:Transcript_55348/g.103842  ORF Transcript_55348/g.103842 Transcript_55348/m.103842 type:complete len:229 (+) Transcript_55348:650-1336(+)
MSGKWSACRKLPALRRSCSLRRRRPSCTSISSRSALLRQLCLEELRRERRDMRDSRESQLATLMSEHDRADLQGEGVMPTARPRPRGVALGVSASTWNFGAASRGARLAERAESTDLAGRGDGLAELPPEDALEGLAEVLPRSEWLQDLSSQRGAAERPRAVLRGRQDVWRCGPCGTVSAVWPRLAERPLRRDVLHSESSSSMSELSEHTLRRELKLSLALVVCTRGL